eukprot:3073294-Rhodomonas_salina.1
MRVDSKPPSRLQTPGKGFRVRTGHVATPEPLQRAGTTPDNADNDTAQTTTVAVDAARVFLCMGLVEASTG